MRKVLLLSILFVFFATYTATAQLSAGIKGGVNSGWLAPRPNNEDSEGRLGFGFGGFLRANIPVVGLHVQPELIIGTKGGKFVNVNNNVNTSTTYSLTTLDIPVLLGKGFAGNLIRFQIGPQLSFVLSDRFKTETTFANRTTTLEGDITNTNNFLMGWQVGIGADLTKITLDLRYEGTLSNYNKDNANYRPQAVWFTVGFKFL